MDLGSSWRFAKGIAKAVKRGNLFPKSTRIPPRPAPGGTRESSPAPSGVAELDWILTREHLLPVEGLREPVRILHVTDVHLRGLDAWTERLAEKVSKVEADLVLLTGDMITRGWKNDAVTTLLGALPKAPLGRFAVMGNWEYWGGAPEQFWGELIAKHGVTLLHDRSVRAGPLRLVGTDDLLAGRPNLGAAFRDVSPEETTVVMTHSPGIFPDIARPGVKLVLSGHAHAGQVLIPGLGALFLPRGCGEFAYGWYQIGESWMYVGSGVGWSVAPLRHRAPPELAIVQLVPA